MLHRLAAGPALKHRQTKGEQQILEDPEMGLGTLAGNLGLTGEGGVVEKAGVEEADHLRKRAKSPICRTRASACTSTRRSREAYAAKVASGSAACHTRGTRPWWRTRCR